MLFQAPVKVGLELGANVRMDNEHSEGKPPDDLMDEADG